jgi:hypothetical protein
LPDLSLTTPPHRNELLRLLRLRLPEAMPGLQLLAEGILGADSRIDFVGVDSEGRATLVMVGEDDGGLALFARALAQRAWVADRLRDWLQLAPALGIRPEAGIGLILMSPGFSAETRAAVRSLGESAPQLTVYRCVRNGAGVETLLEPVADGTASPAPRPSPAPESAPFRTGLSDADLGLSPAERSEFE